MDNRRYAIVWVTARVTDTDQTHCRRQIGTPDPMPRRVGTYVISAGTCVSDAPLTSSPYGEAELCVDHRMSDIDVVLRTDCGAQRRGGSQCDRAPITNDRENVMSGRKVLATLGVAIMAAMTTVFVAAAPASAAIGYNKLFQNQYSRKCLEISYGSTANMAPAGQYGCYGGPIEQWNYNTSTGLIQNVNSGKCLEVLNYSTANFAPVGQYDCYGGANQKWYLNPSTGLIANQYSGKCLEVLYYSTADLAPVGQYDCYGGANQTWWWS